MRHLLVAAVALPLFFVGPDDVEACGTPLKSKSFRMRKASAERPRIDSGPWQGPARPTIRQGGDAGGQVRSRGGGETSVNTQELAKRPVTKPVDHDVERSGPEARVTDDLAELDTHYYFASA